MFNTPLRIGHRRCCDIQATAIDGNAAARIVQQAARGLQHNIRVASTRLDDDAITVIQTRERDIKLAGT